jgi:hypothetical protein
MVIGYCGALVLDFCCDASLLRGGWKGGEQSDEVGCAPSNDDLRSLRVT